MPDYAISDSDDIVLEEAEQAVFDLDMQYRKALRTPGADYAELGERTDEAYEKLDQARKRLIQADIKTTDADIVEIRRIRHEIDKAAGTQQAIEGAVKFIAFVAKFVA